MEKAHGAHVVMGEAICCACTSNCYCGGQAVGGQVDSRWPCDAARLVAEVRRLHALDDQAGVD